MIPSGSTMILVVEDEEPIRSLICAMLLQSGYETLEAADGEEALALWASHQDRITAVLTDVVMPRMKGTELARQIRKAAPKMVVIFISGYSDDPVLDGVDDIEYGFVAKPFTLPELTAAVRDALENAPRR